MSETGLPDLTMEFLNEFVGVYIRNNKSKTKKNMRYVLGFVVPPLRLYYGLENYWDFAGVSPIAMGGHKQDM
jgi:hypothetical protein